MDDDRGGEQVEDDRPPICPACGVTMGIAVDGAGRAGHVCLECGYPDEADGRWAGSRPTT